MVNTALYPVGSFALTSELPAFRFWHKKHETKWKSIFIKITLNCSLFNIFRYVVKHLLFQRKKFVHVHSLNI